MSKTAATFFALLLVLASCYIPGCSVPSSQGAPHLLEHSRLPKRPVYHPGREAVFQGAGQWKRPWIILRRSGQIRKMQSLSPDLRKNISNISMARILTNRDMPADWMIVVERAGKSSMVTISSLDPTISEAPGIAWTEINTSQIMYPRELIEKNHALIFNTSDSRYYRFTEPFP